LIDPIRFTPISTIDWQPMPTSTPVQLRKAIHGTDWIPLVTSQIKSCVIHDPPLTFQSFLTTLDKWEQELFVDLTMEVDCYQLIQIVNAQPLNDTDNQLITASDGSDDSGLMTFGWVIALPSGRQLASCAGPAYGPSGSSFCAEGYDFLSVS
jgi:hypothetical protein